MKNLIRIIAFSMLAISNVAYLHASFLDSLPYYESAKSNPYQDDDMTREFIKDNKEKLEVVIGFEIFYMRKRTVEYNWAGIMASYRPNTFFSIFNMKEFSAPSVCNKYISLNKSLGSYSLIFNKNDVVALGKKEMYRYANECFNEIYRNAVTDAKYEEEKKNYVEPALVEKFTK